MSHWKAAHKKDCLSSHQRCTRARDAILDEMPAAQERWDSQTVIKLGRRCLHDFTLARWKSDELQDEAEIELYELMARACSREREFEESIDFSKKEIAICERLGLFEHIGRAEFNVAGMQRALGRYEEARISYQKVHAFGEGSGSFELYAKSCLGLSELARLDGELVEARRLAEESLTATGLYQAGQYGKSRDEANALLAIVSYCDIESEGFDETRLDRLTVLGREVDEDPREGGGSFIGIRTAGLLGRRHLAMGRILQGAVAYKRVVETAKQHRFLKNTEVQNLAMCAKATLCDLQFSGLLQ